VGDEPRVELGVMAPYAPELITSGPFLRDYAAAIEAVGVESVWAVEHVVVAEAYEPNYPYSAEGRMPSPRPDAVPMPDPLELLAFLAACSSTLRLGTAVVVAPLHRAAVLAKRAATLDLLSGGRFLLGLGIGWQKEEYATVGASFDRRGLQLDECIAAMRSLWGPGPSTFHGETVSFDAVHLVPKPTSGAVPIVLGGNSAPAVRRAGRVADGWFPFTLSPDDLADGVEALHAAAREAGRGPGAIAITAWPGSFDPTLEWDVDWVRRYVDAGARRLLLSVRIARPDQLDELTDTIGRYRAEVLDKL